MSARARIPLVLLPAMLCDAELYRVQTVALADLADARVIVPTEASLARSAQAVLAQAPPRFALGGTSAGGNLALEILAMAPERVAGFWLSGSNAGAHRDPAGAERLSERVRAGEYAAVVDELAALCIYEGGLRASEALTELRAMALRAGPDLFLRQNEAVITRTDRSTALKGYGGPTLLLWGRHDRFAPPDRTRDLTATAPHAQLVVVEECGHLPTLETPTAATSAIRQWLRSL